MIRKPEVVGSSPTGDANPYRGANETRKVTYFSERETGEVPRTKTDVTGAAWRGIATLIQARIEDGSFGAHYPESCPDNSVSSGTNRRSFWDAMRSEIPDLPGNMWTLLSQDQPLATLLIMDMIEFCWHAVGKPIQLAYHAHFKHHHFKYDVKAGREYFCEAINRIFRRNGLVYELTDAGKIHRLAPPVLREALAQATFSTGDSDLDVMLETARRKFFSPDEAVRREALEKLWDAWERVKTVEPGANKSAQVTTLLNRAANSNGSKFRVALEAEAKELTQIGNTFQIRHTETTQESLTSADHVDYLFHRLFAFVRLALRTTGRGG